MNKIDYDILQYLLGHSQKPLSETSRKPCSIRSAPSTKAIQRLKNEGLIDDDNRVRPKVKKPKDYAKPHKAVIPAAGFGLRMIPFNFDTPKGLWKSKANF